MDTHALSPLEQLQTLAQEEDQTLQTILDQAIFLIRRKRARELDRATRRDPVATKRDFGMTPGEWACQDILDDAALLEDLALIYRDPQYWQVLIKAIDDRAAALRED